MSWFRDCSYYINNNLFIQPPLCRAAKKKHAVSPDKSLFVKRIQTSTRTSYMINKLCTYCTHYTSVNSSLNPGGSCLLPYVQCTCTQSHQPRVPSCSVMHGGCPIWAVMIKRKGSKMKNAGFFLQRRNLVVMAFCTSLCSAVLSWATALQEGLYHINCNFLNSDTKVG